MINYFGNNYIQFNEKYFNNIIKYNIVQIIPRFLLETLAVIGVVFALFYLISLEINRANYIFTSFDWRRL